MGATMPAIESDELHQADVDSFIARNRDALNESISASIAELEQGIFSTRSIDDVIADGHKRHRVKN